jgi:hypothetical protein
MTVGVREFGPETALLETARGHPDLVVVSSEVFLVYIKPTEGINLRNYHLLRCHHTQTNENTHIVQISSTSPEIWLLSLWLGEREALAEQLFRLS